MASTSFYHWFAGLTDGEGCFMIQSNSSQTYQCIFRISMRNDDSAMLNDIVKQIGFGFFKKQQRKEYFSGGSWHKPTSAYVVSSVADCIKLVEIFDKYPLRSKKARDYKIWREAVIYASSIYKIKNADRSLLGELSLSIKNVRIYREA